MKQTPLTRLQQLKPPSSTTAPIHTHSKKTVQAASAVLVHTCDCRHPPKMRYMSDVSCMETSTAFSPPASSRQIICIKSMANLNSLQIQTIFRFTGQMYTTLQILVILKLQPKPCRGTGDSNLSSWPHLQSVSGGGQNLVTSWTHGHPLACHIQDGYQSSVSVKVYW